MRHTLALCLALCVPSLAAASPAREAAQAYADRHAGGKATVGKRPVFRAQGIEVYPIRQELFSQQGFRMKSYTSIGQRQVNKFVVVRTDGEKTEALGIVPLKSLKKGALPASLKAPSTGMLLHLPKDTTLALAGSEVKFLAKDEKAGRGTYLVVPGEKAETPAGWRAQPNTRMGQPFYSWRSPRNVAWESVTYAAQGMFLGKDENHATTVSVEEPGYRMRTEAEQKVVEQQQEAQRRAVKRQVMWQDLKRLFFRE